MDEDVLLKLNDDIHDLRRRMQAQMIRSQKLLARLERVQLDLLKARLHQKLPLQSTR